MHSLCRYGALLLALLLFAAGQVDAGSNQKLELRSGDHISIIGNTLADRLQHFGWLETLMQDRFPAKQLSFRNLGFSGDELTERIRSANFGSPDQWLSRTKADVVFAMFGYNESYEGKKGLEKFERDLNNFIDHTLSQKYNGTSTPRLVLFSPIAFENLKSRNLPDGVAANKRLKLYTDAMARIARERNVAFVDLFTPTQALYKKSRTPLTFNGVHLTDHGYKVVAEIIDTSLFGARPAQADTAKLDRIHQAVLEKNFYWFNRYRTVDGFNVFGGRSKLTYKGISNLVVMQREMEILDVMTANRDKRVWAAANGVQPDKQSPEWTDSNTPPFIDVGTNKPGPLPGGKHLFLSGEDAIAKMKLKKGLKVNLFASEQEFPDLVNPVQMAFDPAGRLWVAVWPTYPHWKPKDSMNDKLIILEDTDGDGKADKQTTFVDDIHCPTGFEFYQGGVIVAQCPDLLYLKDTDGDGKADIRKRILSGLDSADTHHAANSFTFDPGGALYFQEGTFHHTQVETPYGPPVRSKNAAAFRYEPRTQKFDVYINVPFANPHGHAFDRWGQDIIVDGTGAVPYHAALCSGQTVGPDQRHPRPITVYNRKTRPCPGIDILSSRHFPEEMQGNMLVANVIGFQGIMQYKLEDSGASFVGTEEDFIVTSSDPNFRPADLKVGPEGALYFIDWHNPIIGHMQHHIRDPNRDKDHGRVYRITHESRPFVKQVKIAGEPIDKLVALLAQPEDRVRNRVRSELGGRDADKVVAAVQKWARNLDPKDANYEHNMLEALWMHQYMNVVNEGLLKRMLRSPEFRARAAATRVLCYWRERVREPLELLRVQINDSNPRVRLEAVRALSFFPLPGGDRGEAALAVTVELLVHPMDKYLNFVFNETLNTLERRIGSGKLNRKNIAVTLVNLLESGKLDTERQVTLIEAICRNGGAKELQTIWNRARDKEAYPLAQRRQALVWLADAAKTRRVQPDVEAGDVKQLLTDVPSTLLPEALELATAWKVKGLAGDFKKIASNAKYAGAARFAAMEGLANLGDADSVKALRELTDKQHALGIRFQAAQALASVNLEAGAQAAAEALAVPKQEEDPTALVQAFLNRKHGSDVLATAIERKKIEPDTAKRILRAMFLSGRSDANLANIVSRFAGLDTIPKPPTPAEVKQLIAEVTKHGDAVRGQRVFRRADLGCIKCHAINKAGGDIGPDLGPIGGSSPLDYIITSVLDPNGAIKEEYITKVLATSSGQILTGVVVERNKNVVVLKDAVGKIIRVPTADIEEEFKGKSLMPEGVSRILTRAELLDLLAFVSELGKPGPFAIPSTPSIKNWKKLRTPSTALLEGVPNREVLRDSILAADADVWDTVPVQADGKLPLAELLKPGQPRVVYLQGEIQVKQTGKLTLDLQAPTSATWWIDEEPVNKPGSTTVDLTAGLHRVTVRVEIAANTDAGVRLELNKPDDSSIRFDVVR